VVTFLGDRPRADERGRDDIGRPTPKVPSSPESGGSSSSHARASSLIEIISPLGPKRTRPGPGSFPGSAERLRNALREPLGT
jgi:hypothetical protein